MNDQQFDRRQALKIASVSAIAGGLVGCSAKQDQLPAAASVKPSGTYEGKDADLLRKLMDAGVEIKNVHGVELNSLDELKSRSNLTRDELDKVAASPDFAAWGAWTLRF